MKLINKIYEIILWIRDVATFGQWILFWNWIKLAHSSSEEASSKRLYGGIMILSCIVLFFLFSAGIFDMGAWPQIAPYWTFLLVLGVALISISTVEKIAQVIANLKIQQIFGKEKT